MATTVCSSEFLRSVTVTPCATPKQCDDLANIYDKAKLTIETE